MAKHDNPVTATLAGIAERLRSGASRVALAPDDRLDGKLCLVTGANRGLGKGIVRALARLGARLVVVCRSGLDEALETARQAGAPARGYHVDLADLASIRQLADQLRDDGIRLDVAVFNAGLVTNAARPSAQGYEMMLAVNFLAKVQLLDRLLRDGTIPNATFGGNGQRLGQRPRVIFVSSEAHRSAQSYELDTLAQLPSFGMKESVARYGYTKLLLTAYGLELARRLDGPDPAGPDVHVHVVCPGAVDTSIAREAPAWSKPILAPTMKLLFRSPDEAAAPIAYLAAARALEGRTGRYFHTHRDKAPSALASDRDAARALWEAAETLIRD